MTSLIGLKDSNTMDANWSQFIVKSFIANIYLINCFFSDNNFTLIEFTVCPTTECSRILPNLYLFTLETESIVLKFSNEEG